MSYRFRDDLKLEAIKYEKESSMEDGFIYHGNFYSNSNIDFYLSLEESEDQIKANEICGCIDLKNIFIYQKHLTIPAIECLNGPTEIKEGQWIVTFPGGFKKIFDNEQFKKIFERM